MFFFCFFFFVRWLVGYSGTPYFFRWVGVRTMDVAFVASKQIWLSVHGKWGAARETELTFEQWHTHHTHTYSVHTKLYTLRWHREIRSTGLSGQQSDAINAMQSTNYFGNFSCLLQINFSYFLSSAVSTFNLCEALRLTANSFIWWDCISAHLWCPFRTPTKWPIERQASVNWMSPQKTLTKKTRM